MSAPKFVITSTGRSGSGYISKVLREVGVNCGHEEYFVRNARRRQNASLDGDSSVWALPHLAAYNGIIVHQVRHPLKVLTSLWRGREKMKKANDVWKLRTKYMPNRTDNLMVDFVGMIVLMNDHIRNHADYLFRTEDIDKNIVRHLANFAGKQPSPAKIDMALNRVSVNYNSHHSGQCLTWDEVPDSNEKELLINQAKRYDYVD